jgi:hypothetical protein
VKLVTINVGQQSGGRLRGSNFQRNAGLTIQDVETKVSLEDLLTGLAADVLLMRDVTFLLVSVFDGT